MRYLARNLVLVAALAVAGTVFAAPGQAAKKSITAAGHTVTGTVKSLDDSSLVLSRKKGGDMTFVVGTGTARQGTPAVGSDVSVRYHSEGKAMMATAITTQPVKQVASAKPVAAKKK
jgi:hypothetical protein